MYINVKLRRPKRARVADTHSQRFFKVFLKAYKYVSTWGRAMIQFENYTSDYNVLLSMAKTFASYLSHVITYN